MTDLADLTIIGVAGQAGSGKDTIAAYLQKKYVDVWCEPFADPIKVGASHIFGIPLAFFHDTELKEVKHDYWGVSPREIAQYVGTELFRDNITKLLPQVTSTFWIRRLFGKLTGTCVGDDDGIYTPGDCVVIPDVRFQNEVDAITQAGGYILVLNRPGLSGDVGIKNHLSELELMHIRFSSSNAYRIVNDSTLEDLYEQVEQALNHFQVKLTPRDLSVSDL